MKINTGGGAKNESTPNNGPSEEELKQRAMFEAYKAEQERKRQALQQAEEAQKVERSRLEAIQKARQEEQLRLEAERAQVQNTPQEEYLEESYSEEESYPEILRGSEKFHPTFRQRLLGYLKPEEEGLPKKKRKGILRRRRLVRAGIAVVVILVLVLSMTAALKRFVWPAEAYVSDTTVSGAGAIESWNLAINGFDTDGLNGIVPDSYIAQEANYVNQFEDRMKFVNTVLGTVKYEIPEVDRETIYGGKVTQDGRTVTGPSDMMNGESVKLTYIDYSQITFDKKVIEDFVKSQKFNVKDPDISVKLTDLYVKYVLALQSVNGNLPTKTIDWVPNLSDSDMTDQEGKQVIGKVISSDEDIALDNLLFASNEFWVSQYKFSKAVLGGEGSEQYEQWLGLKQGSTLDALGQASNSTQEDVAPSENTEDLVAPPVDQPTAAPTESVETNSNFPAGMEGNASHLFARPGVGNYKFIQPQWIGANYLQDGAVKFGESFGVNVRPVAAPIGNGTKESPAGQNTSVFTYQFDTIKGKTVKTPIRVEILSVLEGQDAINYFQSKDTRNRGFYTASQIKYMAVTYKVTNLGDKEVSIRDNSTLSDDQENTVGRTGSVFGLTESVKLKPGQSGNVEGWAASTNLDKLYLIWGTDFSRRTPVVWFRELSASEGEVTRQEMSDDAPDAAPSTGSGDTEPSADVVQPLDEVPESGGTTDNDGSSGGGTTTNDGS